MAIGGAEVLHSVAPFAVAYVMCQRESVNLMKVMNWQRSDFGPAAAHPAMSH